MHVVRKYGWSTAVLHLSIAIMRARLNRFTIWKPPGICSTSLKAYCKSGFDLVEGSGSRQIVFTTSDLGNFCV